MALLGTDLFIVSRGSTHHKMTAAQVADFVGVVQDLTATTYANMIAGTFVGGETAKVGDKVFIADATGDATVDAGYAGYRIDSIGPVTATKMYEQESMDFTIVSATNLSYTAATASGTINNDNGDDVVLPAVTATEAGLATPAMLNASHVAAAALGAATANPVVVSAAQEVSFNIDQLTALP